MAVDILLLRASPLALFIYYLYVSMNPSFFFLAYGFYFITVLNQCGTQTRFVY